MPTDEAIEALPYDATGNLPRGDNGDRLPPAAPAAENTDAAQPSPDPAKPPAPVETKTDAAPVAEPGTPTAKPSTPDEGKLSDEETTALKEKHSRPGETGDEWKIRAARDGYKTRKQLEPVADVMERIGSPDRARRGLELTAELADPEVPIANAWSKMTALSSSRAEELHNFLYDTIMDTFPDTVAKDLVGEPATAAELKEGLKLLRSGAAKTAQPQSTATTTPGTAPKPAGMSDEDWADFQIDYPDVYKAMQAQATPPEKPAEPKAPEVHPAEAKLKEIEKQKQEEWVNAKVQEIQTEGEKLYSEAFEVVNTGLRDLGLVPDPAKHDEKQVKLIERTAKRIQESVEKEFDGPDGPKGTDDYSLCSEEQKLNRKLVKTTIDLLAKGDFTAARDYLDRIKAQVDLAFQRAADPELELYNAAMLQSTTKTRDGSQHTRPELVGGTAPGGQPGNKTPWLEPGYRQPGETSQQAMMRYLEERAA